MRQKDNTHYFKPMLEYRRIKEGGMKNGEQRQGNNGLLEALNDFV